MIALYLGIFWLLYYILHSAFAAQPVKRFFRNVFPSVYPHYRALYSTIAVVNFVLLAGLHVRLPSPFLWQPLKWALGAGAVFALAGAVVMLVALRQYGTSFLMKSEESVSGQPSPLITTGLNAYVRHPLYFGILLLLTALLLSSPSGKNVIFCVISAAYIVVGSIWEEQRLEQLYGEQYREYRRRVKMLIPYAV